MNNRLIFRAIGAALALALMAGAASAQSLGIVAPGHVIGNGKSTNSEATDSPISSVIDQGICGVSGDIMLRGTFVWSCLATLGYANGGTNATTAAGAFSNLAPTPTRTGDILIWNGSAWATVPGNNSGTQCFIENSSGSGSFGNCTTGGGSGTVNSGNAGAIAYYATTGTAVSQAAVGTNVLTAISNNIGAAGGLTQIIPTIEWYVCPTGSDSANTGQSSGSPFATLRHWANVVSSYDLGGNAGVIVNDCTAGGSYAGFELSGPFRGPTTLNANAPYIEIVGAGSAKTTITQSTTGGAVWDLEVGGANIVLTGVKLSIPAGDSGVFAQNYASVTTEGDVLFNGGASSSVGIHAEEYSYIYPLSGSTKTSGTLGYIYTAGLTGEIEQVSGAYTIAGTVGSLALLENASMSFNAPTFSGTFTGPPIIANGSSFVAVTPSVINPTSTVPSVYSYGSNVYTGTTPITGGYSGCGTGCTVTLAVGSNSKNGYFIITPGGTGISSSGGFGVTFGENFTMDYNGSYPAPYSLSLVQNGTGLGTGGWQGGSGVALSGRTAGGMSLVWSNNSVNLTSGATYYIHYGTSP